jgi:hypothetical protein
MMRVLICDDRKAECQDTLEAAREGAPRGVRCESLHSDELTETLKKFFVDIKHVLNGKKVPPSSMTGRFDGQDIIILDNNLSHLKIEGARLTAEAIAGYVRAFTTTPYVISLNKNHQVDFDLQYLIGDNGTRADLAINTPHLRNRSLWTGRAVDASDGFHPWYWPALILAPERRRKQIAFVQMRIKKPILKGLQFPTSSVAALSRHAKGLLSSEAQYGDNDSKVRTSLSGVTFEQFFGSSARSLPADEDRTNLIKCDNHEVIARVVAGELDCWLRRDVLGPQDVLVDLPHLLVRMPFLLGKRAADLKAWNASTNAKTPPFGLETSLYKRFLSPHRFKLNSWAVYPVFWGQSLKQSEKLTELFFKAEKDEWGDFVFCEDTSTFQMRTDDDSSEVMEFVAEFETPWDRRYIAGVRSKHYAPRSRLAL